MPDYVDIVIMRARSIGCPRIEGEEKRVSQHTETNTHNSRVKCSTIIADLFSVCLKYKENIRRKMLSRDKLY